MFKKVTMIVLMFSSLLLTACNNKTESYDYNYTNGILKAEINDEYIYIDDNIDSNTISFFPTDKDNKSFISVAGIEEKYDIEKSKELINLYKSNLNENYQTSKQNTIEQKDNIVYAEYSLLDMNNEVFQIKNKVITDENNTYMIVMFSNDKNSEELKKCLERLYESLTIK